MSREMIKNDPQKVAVVTGASGVLGFETVKALRSDDYTVIMVDINQDALEQKSAEIGSGVHSVVLNISDPQKVSDACEKIRQKFGKISVLVNNAGILSNNKAIETTVEEWRKIIAVNLDGTYFLSREFLPDMKDMGWGRIINICSVAMKTGGLTAGTAYTTSKGAMAALTFSLAREFAPYGITVNGISPAYIKTPMITEFLTPDQQSKLLEQIPAGRFCEAKEVAHVVRFLTSPLSGFILGEIIDINGGLHMD